MPADPLASLARLRRLQTGLARQRLAEQAARVGAAEARTAAADLALHAERGAGDVADFGAWVARGLAERDRARIGLRLTEARAAEARDGLVAARTAERALEVLREARATALAKRLVRRADRALDDRAAQRH